MSSLNEYFRPGPHTASETTDNQTVVINLNTGDYISLNTTGSFLWERLNGAASLDDISAQLANTYSVDKSITDQDVLKLATELEKEGMIIKI